MARAPFPITTFVHADNTPLANGYLLIQVSTDVLSPEGQIGSRQTVKIPLDANGVILGLPTFWSTFDLFPTSSYYVLRAYSVRGQLVFGPMKVIVGGYQSFGFGTAFGSYFGS